MYTGVGGESRANASSLWGRRGDSYTVPLIVIREGRTIRVCFFHSCIQRPSLVLSAFSSSGHLRRQQFFRTRDGKVSPSGISAFGQWCQELALDSDPTSAGSLRWGPFSQVVTETMAERESRWKVKVKMPTSTWSGRTGEAPEQVRAGLECGVLVRSRQDDPSQPKGCQQGGKDCAWKIWGWGRGARSAGRGLDPQAGRWTSAGQEGGIHPERQGTNQTPACGLSRSPAPRRSGCLSTQGRWSTFYCRGRANVHPDPSAPVGVAPPHTRGSPLPLSAGAGGGRGAGFGKVAGITKCCSLRWHLRIYRKRKLSSRYTQISGGVPGGALN